MSGTGRGALLAGALLGLTGCSDGVDGTASPAGDGGSSSGSTASCAWQPELPDSSQPAVELPPEEVPTDGSTAVRMTTGQGELTFTVDHAAAPCAAASLVHLAGQGFFDDTVCHRETDVTGLQVLQCGDPTGTGTGGPGYGFPTDVDGDESYPRGTVAMANSGQGLDGSQFFLVWGDSQLPPDYTVFGRVDDPGLEVLDAISAKGNDGANGPGDGAPTEEVRITSMTVS